MNKRRVINFAISLLSAFLGSQISHYALGGGLVSFSDMCIIAIVTCWICEKDFIGEEQQ